MFLLAFSGQVKTVVMEGVSAELFGDCLDVSKES